MIALVAALLLLLSPPLHAAETSPAEFVVVRHGALPIVITAPHGGRQAIPGVAPRNAEETKRIHGWQNWGGVTLLGDGETDVLAQNIAAELERLTGKAPYLVVAKFHRKYIDANRPPELAMNGKSARPYYDLYHQTIRRFVDEVRTTYPAGLLMDVHGQAKDGDVLMRGTINGSSVYRLVRRAGANAVIGASGIYGQLEANGFKIFPGNDVPLGGTFEDAGFKGGYTVATYGSHNRDGIDAVQLEFGTRYRQKAVVAKSAVDAAKAIAAFYETHLKQADRR